MGRTVLVTGAAGLLGGEVSRRYARAGDDVRALSRPELDVTDAEAVQQAVEYSSPSLVVHCAAMTRVDDCEVDPERAFATNAEGSRNVARAAAAVGAEIVMVSTDYVFDGSKGNYVEEDPTGPIQVYGRSKLAGEDAVREASPHHYVVRSAWIYGRGGKNFLSKLPGLASQQEPITAVTDQVGSPTYACDLAEAIERLAASGAYGTYHVINTGSCTFAEFCRYGLDLLGSQALVNDVTFADLGLPAPRPRDTSLLGAAWKKEGFGELRGWREAAEAFLSSVR